MGGICFPTGVEIDPVKWARMNSKQVEKNKCKYAVVRSFNNGDLIDVRRRDLATLDIESGVSQDIKDIIENKRIEYFRILIFLEGDLESIRKNFKFNEENLFFAKVIPEPEVTKVESGSSISFYKLSWLGK